MKQDGQKTTEGEPVNSVSMEVSAEDTPTPKQTGMGAGGNTAAPPSESNPPAQDPWQQHRARLGEVEALAEKSRLQYLPLEENIVDRAIIDIDGFKRDLTLYPISNIV